MTVDSHSRDGRSDNAAHAIADRATWCYPGVLHERVKQVCCCEAGVSRGDIAEGISEVTLTTWAEKEALLRWLVELDSAVMSRLLVDPSAKLVFAMPCLGGRTRGWAYGRRLTDPTCFSTYKPFEEKLKLAFEPPQNEFRSRAEFLDLQQGKQDVHAYA
ncbi:LOW QUALITY PROTEIN: hypothetical protein PHMEG_00020995 [Phytophthora megakarya]|uniref:Retrotransposon gag domain-containing protein n=1 Tax=Phytophthora megakarya TaxID=4795 RepID=A0A225VP98_9STRA|nr:LOW QUALITY PROTEIN: hypothetical protein PHMEG_00020995 [Phytophthora megakarya]